MKIADIGTTLIRSPLDGKLRNPLFRWTEKLTLLVFVRAEDGTLGVGEAWCAAGSAAVVETFLREDLRPELIGEDAHLVEGIMRRFRRRCAMSSRKSETDKALSAVDIALWDLKGKAAGLPLWRMLGGCDARVAAYASGGLYRDGQSLDAFAAAHAREIAAGFRAVKVKVGGAPLAVDVARIAALREAIGADAGLMIDGVANLDVPGAIVLGRALRPYGITWFEQPVVNENVAGLARIHREVGIPTAGNENEAGLDAFQRLIDAEAVHYVQFDPVIGGGFTEGRKIAALAEAHHLPVTLHHSNSVVSMLANIHLAAALPNCHSVEFHMIHRQLFEHAPDGCLGVADGYLVAPERPGLGADLDSLAPW